MNGDTTTRSENWGKKFVNNSYSIYRNSQELTTLTFEITRVDKPIGFKSGQEKRRDRRKKERKIFKS